MKVDITRALKEKITNLEEAFKKAFEDMRVVRAASNPKAGEA